WHFGRGIVDTPSNFGMAGDQPTHPELLDYLASKFLADGMSIKKLHKDILKSRTYQLSAAPLAANVAKDPSNTLYWRANRNRVDSEGVWDLLLQASNTLDITGIGGPSDELNEKMKRRAVYAQVSRMYPADFHATFDLPTATISTEKRYTTNVPQQRLFFLNNTLVHKQADAIAELLKFEPTPEARVKKAFGNGVGLLVHQRVVQEEQALLRHVGRVALLRGDGRRGQIEGGVEVRRIHPAHLRVDRPPLHLLVQLVGRPADAGDIEGVRGLQQQVPHALGIHAVAIGAPV